MPLVPLEWLSEHVDVLPGTDPAQLAAALVRVGLEEEEIHPGEVVGPVVVGKVLTREAKEQSNGKVINYCRVDVGEHNDAPGTGKEPSDLASRGIICGAHNFDAGDYVVVSLPGAVLPGDFQIAARKTYGHISDGMICSQRELGLGDDHDGIIVLAHSDAEAVEKDLPEPGQSVLDYLGLPGEVLEINVTPDRGYCFSMRGVAREYAHSTGAAYRDPALESTAAKSVPAFNNQGFAVEVNDVAPIHGVPGADRFVTRIVRGVKPGASSPSWLQRRLLAAGMRPISLVVDATNYVMLDLGQPLHAYDLSHVHAPLVVRRARAGETLRTLDDVERALDLEDLVIADSPAGEEGARVVGLAGTMGGQSTEVTSQTVDVLIEAAHFDPVSVARMARRHRLPSEASKRFERGVDPQLAPVAAQAVVDLLVEYGGGTAAVENFDYAQLSEPLELQYKTTEVARLAGLNTDVETQISWLSAIGCEVVTLDQRSELDATLQVTPPSWRPDLVGSAHLVEEIARLVGYDEIPVRAPLAPAGHGLTQTQRQRRDSARALAELGWVQVLSYPFVSGAIFDQQEIVADDERRRALRLKNPLQEEAPYLRTSLLDTLLTTAQLNVARSNPHVAVFELGAVTRPQNMIPAAPLGTGARPSAEDLARLHAAVPSQPTHLAGVAAPHVTDAVAGFEAVNWDWRDALEAVRVVSSAIGVRPVFSNANYAPFHPGRCAEVTVAGKTVGFAGELAPRVCKSFDLPPRSIAFELDLDLIGQLRGNSPIQVAAVATFPVAKEDIALVVDEAVTVDEVAQVVRKGAGELLESLSLFDVYRGDQIPEGKKSLAFALRLRGREQTLTAEDAAGVRNRVVKLAKKAFGASLRG